MFGTACSPLGVKGMPISELKAAEGTVVQGKAENPEQKPERIERHLVDLVPASESGQFKIVTLRAVGKPLEQREAGAVVITIHSAVFTVKGRTANDALNNITAFAAIQLAAAHASCIDSSEKQFVP